MDKCYFFHWWFDFCGECFFFLVFILWESLVVGNRTFSVWGTNSVVLNVLTSPTPIMVVIFVFHLDGFILRKYSLCKNSAFVKQGCCVLLLTSLCFWGCFNVIVQVLSYLLHHDSLKFSEYLQCLERQRFGSFLLWAEGLVWNYP